jgi:hypothetical protein
LVSWPGTPGRGGLAVHDLEAAIVLGCCVIATAVGGFPAVGWGRGGGSEQASGVCRLKVVGGRAKPGHDT